jgi:CHAT domain-containing protein
MWQRTWRRILPVLLAAAACSRSPSPGETYSQAWDAFRQGKLQQSQQFVDSALKRYASGPPEALDPLRLLQTEIFLARGQARAAQDLLNGLPDSQLPLSHLRWLVDRADAYSKLGQGDRAIDLLDQVDRTAGSNAATDPVVRGRILRGGILLRARKFDDADQVLERAAALAAGTDDIYNQAGALLNLALSKYGRRRYDESLNYSRPALEAAEKVHAGRIAGLANNNLGMAYTVLRDFDRAEDQLNKAVAQLREIGDQRNLANALGNLGNVQLLTHQLPSAVRNFQEAVRTAKNLEATSDAARWAGRLSLAFTEQRDWADAESWNQQAESLNRDLKQPENLLYLEMNAAAIADGRGNHEEAKRLYGGLIVKSSNIPYLEWNAHVRLGSLLADEKLYSKANREYERGLAVLERVRSSLISDDYRLTYHDALMEFFKDYVNLLVMEKDEVRAFQVAESSRARLLAEKLGLNNDAIGEIRAATLQQYASRHGEALVSYWLAPKRSFVWTVTSRGIHMKTLPGQNEIEDLVRSYQKAILDLRDPLEGGVPQAGQLSQVLLGPIQADLAGAHRVVIVPDGGLHALNLETLPVPSSNRYWIEDVEISLAPSLIMLAETPPQKRVKPSLLLIGAPTSAGAGYDELPAAKSEIEGIQRRFAGRDQVVRIGPDATPQGFLDSMPGRFSMIHFAAHAEANSQSPLESAIILSRNGETFKLYARDITGLKLSADLVTISACRSAGARAYGGEGLVGFTWAFLRSGARSVIAGLWDVADASSSQLIQELYQELESGKQPAEALRQAKRTLLHSAGAYRKPYYWAPFQTYIR